MCDFYHCLPSELDQEPADKVMLYYQLNSIYEDGAASKSRPKTHL